MSHAADLTDLLRRAQARRDAGDWPSALELFGTAAAHAPEDAGIQHNMALSQFALGRPAAALRHVEAALHRQPRLWQSHALRARISRGAGDVAACAASLAAVLAIEPGNATARLGLADLELNEFGDAAAAAALVASLDGDPVHAADAELTTLMARLYDRGGTSTEDLSRRLMAFSARELRLSPFPVRARHAGARQRVGLLSPLFSASPVYFLAFSALAALSQGCDLVAFNRGTRSDWATDAFRRIAGEWHEAAGLDAPALAERIAGAGIDTVIDLGGWSDAIGLKALSAQPARRILTWVGGQSATTGLTNLDGWIGDAWQNPADCDALHTEPVRRMVGGYVDYTPPPGLLAIPAVRRQAGVGLAGNPVKIGPATLLHWPEGVRRVTLVDRRYTHARTRERVSALLGNAGIEVADIIVPQGQAEYLRALGGLAAIVETRPYGTGLTAVEAMALGVKVLAPGPAGRLFSERHQLSHARTGGRNPHLARQIAGLVLE